MTDEELKDNFQLQEGDRVTLIKEPTLRRVVTEIDTNLTPGGVTTCNVLWDVYKPEDLDIQQTNKLYIINTEKED